MTVENMYLEKPNTTHNKPNRFIRAAALASLLIAGLAACDQQADQPPQPTELTTTTAVIPGNTLVPTSMYTAPTTTTLAPGVTSTTVPGCNFDHNTGDAWMYKDDGAVRLSDLYGTEISYGDHNVDGECFERVVVRLARSEGVDVGTMPGVHVHYVDQAIGDPSGEPVNVEGNAFLQIDLGSWLYGPGGGEGPMRIRPEDIDRREMDNVQEIVVTQNFESMSSIVIGLNKGEVPFSVNVLTDMDRDTGTCQNQCIVYVDVLDQE